ncbi:MAG: 50S ribosomal protein L11 methyltransferase [Ghiorsea sp.]
MQNVTCVELKIAANAVAEEAFSQLMLTFNALGGAEETHVDSGDVQRIAWFELGSNPEEQYARLSTAARVLGAQTDDFCITTLNDDWETAWQKNWQAMPVGKNMCVRPSFCPALADRSVDIVLDPGMAFGTGTHPTTYLCLEAVERYCTAHATSGVLDMGAGSGLLAIAAGKFAATDIHAIDYDPISVEASQVNARINGIALTATLDDTPPSRQFDLVVANILAGPLHDMAEQLTACVGKHLILSGLLIEQTPAIIESYEKAGLQHIATHPMQEWAAVEFKVIQA